MKRTTVSLPEDLARVVQLESRRRGVSISAIAREALAARFKPPSKVPFAAVGRSGDATGADRAEELLAATWADAIEADRDQ